jgi:hypothetical protein
MNGEIYYTLKTLDILKNTFLIGTIIDITTFYKEGLLGVTYGVKGSVFSPVVEFNSTNFLMLKFPLFGG